MKVHADCAIKTYRLLRDGSFPNNPRLPLLIYENTLVLDRADGGAEVGELFKRHGWGGIWLNGVFPFHHYHSNTHEVLGCYRGSATVQFGGPNGPLLTLNTGDVAVLPAGTAHKKIEASADFAVVGAYPGAADYDMHNGKPAERSEAEATIAAIPRPDADPVFGERGGIREHWPP